MLYCTIITFRRQSGLGEVLAAICRQTRLPEHLIVIDNEASDLTGELLKAAYPYPCTYIASEENLGPAGGTALAMVEFLRIAQPGDWLLRCDDDSPPDFDNVFEAMESFAKHVTRIDGRVGAIGVVGARYDWSRARLIRINDDELHGPVPVDYVGTNRFAAFSYDAVREVGPFDADLFYGSSEVEYGLRLRRAGWSVYANGDLWAKFGRRTASTAGARWGLRPYNWRRYYSLRNQIHFLRKWGYSRLAIRIALIRGIGKPLLHLPVNPRHAWTHLRMNVRAIRDGWTGRLGRTVEPDV